MRITAIFLMLLLINGLVALFNPTPPKPVTLPVSAAPYKKDPESIGLDTCQEGVYSIAQNPSSVSFFFFTSTPVFKKLYDGRMEVILKFSAKNAFNAESNYFAYCIVSSDGKTLLKINGLQTR
jgi:hypothetical protein